MSDKTPLKFPSPNYGWSMVGLLTLAYIFSMLDRYILGYLIKPIKDDLGFSDLEVGLMTGPAFTLLYATTAIPIGLLVDRRSRTKIIAIGIAVWSLATVMTGFARTFWSMFIARMAVGIGEAVLSPAAFSIIGDSFAPQKRAKPIAFYSGALVIASGLTGFIIAFLLGLADGTIYKLPFIGEVPSWQFIFVCVGAPGLVIALIFLAIKDAPRTESAQKPDENLSDAFKFILSRLPMFLCFMTIFITMVAVAYAQFNWQPEMFERTYGTEDWSRKNYAARNGTAVLFIGLVTYLFSGFISDWWSAKGQRLAPLLLSVIGLLILVPAQFIGPLMPSGWVAFFCVNVLGTIGIGMVSCTGVTALLQVVPGQVRGFTVALYYMTMSFVGGLTSPLLVGYMSSNVFGEDKLYVAMSVLPLIYGIPAILLLPLTIKLYRRELALLETVNA